MKSILLIFILLAAQAHAETKLLIAAAADLRFAMPAIVQSFEKDNPDTRVQVSYGASGTLTTQIEQNAPFDLFFSADSSYPKRLIEKGLATEDYNYAKGTLVVWFPKNSNLHLSREDLKKKMNLLLDPRIKKIAIANPTTAPYGKTAVSALQNEGIYEQVKGKFVLGENIAQTAQFIESGNADLGIIALSLAESSQLQREGDYFEVPDTDYPQLIQSFIILKASPNQKAATAFKNAVLNQKTRVIFEQYGFKN